MGSYGVRVRELTIFVGRGVTNGGRSAKPPPETPDLKTLQVKIGQLALENDFLAGALIKAGLLSAKR